MVGMVVLGEDGRGGDGVCVGGKHGGMDGGVLWGAPQPCPGLLEIPEQQH